jgi:hypothetical protein
MGKKNKKSGHGGFESNTPAAPTGGRVRYEEFLTASRGTPRAVSPTAVGGMPPKVGNMMAPQNTNTGRMKVPEVGSGTVAGVVPTMRATTPKPAVSARPFVHPSAGVVTPGVGNGGVVRRLNAMSRARAGHNFVTNHGHGMSNCNYAGRDEE